MMHKTKMISENLGGPLLSGVGVQLYPGGGGGGVQSLIPMQTYKKCSEDYLDPRIKVKWD